MPLIFLAISAWVVFAGKAHFHQGAYRERAGAFGREGSVAVQGVVYIHHPAALMGAYGYAAAHVGHDQIQSVIGNSLFLGVALCHGLLIQRVENADAGQFRQTGVAGHRSQLVHHHRVYNVGAECPEVRRSPWPEVLPGWKRRCPCFPTRRSSRRASLTL